MSEQGLLSFALGLEAGGFLGPLGKATDGAKAFLTAMLGIGGAVEGFKAAIERGAGLEQLHKRTGETVATLYQLEKGFQAAGLSGDDVSLALFKMEQSLGGVNELGEHTDDIFRRLGLNLHALRHQDSATAMREILGSFGGLNQSGGASAAMSIFGRGVGAEMLQLSRSGKEFAEGMQHAAAAAKTFDQNAQAFDNLETAFDHLKGKGMDLFAGLAAAVTPAAQRIADVFNGIDFSALGNNLGTVLEGFAQSWADGTISELIATAIYDGLQAGFAGGVPLAKLMLDTVALAVLQTVVKMDTRIIEVVATHLPKGMQSNLGMRWADMVGAVNEGSASTLNADKADVAKGIESSFEDLGPLWREIQANADKFKALHPGRSSLADGLKGNKDGLDVDTQPGVRPEFTSLEKMGFVMTGFSNPFMEPQRQTAQNTLRIATGVEALLHAVGINDGSPFRLTANTPMRVSL